jgi:hypothetical protein
MLTKLTDTFNAAVEEQARLRGQTVTPFAMEVSKSILAAGLLAIEDSDQIVAQYRVVSAPTGSGKSSYAQALTKAYISVVPNASVLYLVETVRQAEDIYRDMVSLIGEDQIAVWTASHDLATSPDQVMREHGFVPQRQFSIDNLAAFPVAIVTHSFYKERRRSKATIYQGHNRGMTFVDEQPQRVSIFDIDTGLIKTVRDKLAQEYSSAYEPVRRLTELHDYAEAIWQNATSRSPLDVLPPSAMIDLSWFRSEAIASLLSAHDQQVRTVFGFSRALANGFAFLARYDKHNNGARFVGYDMNMPLMPGTILLDATADIDGLSLITQNRKGVCVPQVDFRNLTITHIDAEPLKYGKGGKQRRRISEVGKRALLAQPYATWIIDTIKLHTKPGEKVLAIVHKAMLDHGYLPAKADFSDCHDLEGRQVCFIHWGVGIGSNRWRDAAVVFLFDEFHKPRQATVATGLGNQEQRATADTLKAYQAQNRKDGPMVALKDGDICRWIKQMAMRGNARNIDAAGVCGLQRLYVTGDLVRLICNVDRMFPGAPLIVDKPEARFQYGGTEALIALLLSSDEDFLSTADVKRLTGVDLRRNGKRERSKIEIRAATHLGGWDPLPGCGGKGNMGGFVRELLEVPLGDQSAILLANDVLPSFEDVED